MRSKQESRGLGHAPSRDQRQNRREDHDSQQDSPCVFRVAQYGSHWPEDHSGEQRCRPDPDSAMHEAHRCARGRTLSARNELGHQRVSECHLTAESDSDDDPHQQQHLVVRREGRDESTDAVDQDVDDEERFSSQPVRVDAGHHRPTAIARKVADDSHATERADRSHCSTRSGAA